MNATATTTLTEEWIAEYRAIMSAERRAAQRAFDKIDGIHPELRTAYDAAADRVVRAEQQVARYGVKVTPWVPRQIRKIA